MANDEPLVAMLTAVESVVRNSKLTATLAKMREACDEDRKSVLPVYCLVNGKPVQDRTGVLLAIANQGFLITAAHGLKRIIDAGIPLYVTSPRRGQGGIPIVGEVHGTEEYTIDSAVIKMNLETKAALDAAGANFLRVTDVDNQAAMVPGIYLVRGYPIDCYAAPATYTTILFQGDSSESSEYPFDANIHLLLDHSRYLRGREGHEFLSPKINGMSGCGIWRMTTKPPTDLAIWKPDERRLVAIQTSCKYGSFLKGTWIRLPFQLIYDKCPELRKVMSSLHLPQ